MRLADDRGPGHALPILMAIGAALFVWLAFQRGAFSEVAAIKA